MFANHGCTIRNADSEAFEKKLPRPAHLLPIPASSQPPLHFFSCDTPLETASVPNVSDVGSNPGHPAHPFDDFAHCDRDDYNGDSGFSGASINGYDDGCVVPPQPSSSLLPHHLNPLTAKAARLMNPPPGFEPTGPSTRMMQG
jgi:hypothetical protein